MTAEPLLSVRHLVKSYRQRRGPLGRASGPAVQAVADVSFDLARGEAMSLVGESGCGKSTTARCITRIIEPTSGSIVFDGTELSDLDHAALQPLRRRFQMVFQDPQASLNPRQRVRDIIGEPLLVHGADRSAIDTRVDELAAMVQLRSDDLDRFPHQFSGGQRQRVGIARALALEPDLLVLDEPVSALDVSIQAQIVRLLQDLRQRTGLTYLLIAHDLAVVRHLSDRVGVMYLGALVETGPRDSVYRAPLHPYTQALISAAPIADPDIERSRRRIVLQGDVPSPLDPPSGCRFRTRCWRATEQCSVVTPVLTDHGDGHHVACHHPEPVEVVARRTTAPQERIDR